MGNKSKFAEIFYPDSVLFNKFDNLDKVRSITNVYDEITVPPGTITSNNQIILIDFHFSTHIYFIFCQASSQSITNGSCSFETQNY